MVAIWKKRRVFTQPAHNGSNGVKLTMNFVIQHLVSRSVANVFIKKSQFKVKKGQILFCNLLWYMGCDTVN